MEGRQGSQNLALSGAQSGSPASPALAALEQGVLALNHSPQRLCTPDCLSAPTKLERISALIGDADCRFLSPVSQLAVGDTVFVTRSDGSKRFGEIVAPAGLPWQNSWEVCVESAPNGAVVSTRAESAKSIGRHILSRAVNGRRSSLSGLDCEPLAGNARVSAGVLHVPQPVSRIVHELCGVVLPAHRRMVEARPVGALSAPLWRIPDTPNFSRCQPW